MRAFMPKGWKRPIITSTNKNLKSWRQDVAAAAEQAMRDLGIEGCIDGTKAIRVEAQFYFTRSMSDEKKKKKKLNKITAPDLDKLCRAVCDAMTGTVFVNDSRVSQLWCSKLLDTRARTVVKVTTIEED
jgi:Holliday junction resolvase RusA-like endonuclease